MPAVSIINAPAPTGVPCGRWKLTDDLASAGLARQLVQAALGDEAAEELRQRALLATSELVANSLRYARPPIHLEVRRTTHQWVIVVTDGEPLPPVPRLPEPLGEGGRGWPIIDQIVQAHGWTPSGDGKAVWIQLAELPGNPQGAPSRTDVGRKLISGSAEGHLS